MALIEGHFMGNNSQHLHAGERQARFLREKYSGRGGAKQLARDLDIDPRTAQNMLDGTWCSRPAIFDKAARFFGFEWLERVCLADAVSVVERINREIENEEREIARQKRDLERLSSTRSRRLADGSRARLGHPQGR